MKRILTTAEHYALRKALWDDVKRLPLPRKARLSVRESLYLEFLAKLEARNEENSLEVDVANDSPVTK